MAKDKRTQTEFWASEDSDDAWDGELDSVATDKFEWPNRLSFDLELARPIPLDDKDKPDWSRATECGASVIVTWGATEPFPYVHLPENAPLNESLESVLEAADGLLSWNGASFDNKCVQALWGGWEAAKADHAHIDLMAILSLLTLGVKPEKLEGGVPDDWQESLAPPQAKRQPWRLFQGLKLTDVAKANLGRGKPEGVDGAVAADIWKTRPDIVVSYCIGDVALVRDLYLKVWDQGFLLVPARGGRVDVPRDLL
jgi:hypothetical protein